MRWLAALLLALLAAVPAAADEIRPFSIEFSERAPGEWSLDWKQPLTTPDASEQIVPQVPGNCRLHGEPVTRPAAMAVIGHAEVRCEGDVSDGVIAVDGLVGNADALVIVAPLGRPAQAHRITASAPQAVIAARPGRWPVFADYFRIGTRHILMGWDHLLFVIALLLLVRFGWSVVKAATAFTLAHTITLVAVTLGYAGLPQRPVEALIALSIVFLAVELLHTDRATLTRRWPWLVAFGFGLLHGFGFAGALREIGLPEGEVPTALLAFNLGVEAGQLLVIAAVLALRAGIRRIKPAVEAPTVKVATYMIGMTASYWVVDRLVG